MVKSMVAAAVLALAAPGAQGQAPGVAETVTKRCAMCHGEKGESMAEYLASLP